MTRAALITVALTLPTSLVAATPPLIYEGTLTRDGVAPVPWPPLRFSVVDAAGRVSWSTVADPASLDVDQATGHFVAYLEDTPDNPLIRADLFDDARLAVDVCTDDFTDCDWLPFEDPQRIGRPLALVGRLITEDLVLTVRHPGDNPRPLEFDSVHAALAWLDGRLILPGAKVTIAIESGTYGPYDASIVIDREDGRRLEIVGVSPPEGEPVVSLLFDDSSGVVIADGARLGQLSNLELVGDGSRRGRDGKNGLSVGYRAWSRIADNVRVRNFSGHCVLVKGGTLLADGAQVSNCGWHGWSAQHGGVLIAVGARADGTDQDGFSADWASLIDAKDSGVGRSRWDFAAHRQSLIHAPDACTGDVPCTAEADGNSYLDAPGLNAHDIVQPFPSAGYIRIED